MHANHAPPDDTPWDDRLLPEQRAAASHGAGHARLLAGPGTGKTLTLTRRIVYLITQEGVDPNHIVALTFTRAAAHELRTRVEKAVGGNRMPRISTLHSFALSQLLRKSNRLDALPEPLRIADNWEERNIVKEDLKMLIGKSRIEEVHNLFLRLAADWESLGAEIPGWSKGFPDPKFLGAWREHRGVYGYVLRSELVYQLKRAFERTTDLKIDGSPRHLLVDEYQDLNRCDLAVVHRLAELGADVFAAGDDDQSIYGFRMAHPDGIRNFVDDYTDAESYVLSICMRCDRSILAQGTFVARQDRRRTEKDLTPRRDAGEGEVAVLKFPSQIEEATGVAQICSSLIKTGNVPPHEILILLRGDRRGVFSKVLAEALTSANVPVAVGTSDDDILDQRTGRQVLAILRLLVEPQDDLAWRTLLQLRSTNGIGDEAQAQIYDLACDQAWRYAETLHRVRDDPALVRRFGTAIETEVAHISTMLETIAGAHPISAPLDRDAVDMLLTSVISSVGGMQSDTDEIREYVLSAYRAPTELRLADIIRQLKAPDKSIRRARPGRSTS